MNCRKCNICKICGKYYPRKDAIICKWIDPSTDCYGIDCNNLACDDCKFCSVDHCSHTKLIRALEVRNEEYMKIITSISRQMRREINPNEMFAPRTIIKSGLNK